MATRTGTQTSLLDVLDGNRWELAYRTWREKHPEVFALYARFAREALARGRKFSVSLLTERIRWESHMTWSPDQGGFKINNSFRAYLARDLIADMPELVGVLEIRATRGREETEAEDEAVSGRHAESEHL